MIKDTITKLNEIKLELKPNKKLNTFLAKKDSVDYIYNTSALEGNAMTYPEVETLLDGVTVGGHKLSDEQMILNQNRSVKSLFRLIDDEEFDISKKTLCSLCSLHKDVAQEEALVWGEFRDANVRIGGTEYIPLDFKKLEDAYTQQLQFIDEVKSPVIKAITYFLLNAKAQYFYDGNKRTARLMMNGILLSNGYPMLNIKAKNKLEFNKMMINYYDSDELLVGVEYLLHYYVRQIDELQN